VEGPVYEGEVAMKCSITGCPGHYEHRLVVHVVKKAEEVLVFEDVPAEVCDVCSDTVLSAETIRHLEALMRQSVTIPPKSHAPVYAYV
jgi:YgiT-type zinc finger domain-containing protein